ncbi:MAG: DNA adenine methylase [Hyphomicrobiales bacterium]|nr:DNA adenine methylase [Hyphomicrobiales bacterium]MDE2113810.1 DNA adenine methylase [Hyphomicrobiales bacterium]
MDNVGQMRPVMPVRPLAGYVGGKRQLAKQLIAKMADIPHGLYAEAFVGMGGVFFRRSLAPRVEVINDYNRDIANLFRVLQRHYQAFLDMLKWQLASRAEFARLLQVDADSLTDLERAARFLYLQRLSFGGKVAGRSFGIDTTNSSRFDMTKLGSMLEDVHERLAGVTIECLDWRIFFDRWDRPQTLFYLDPPYWGTENYYPRGLFGSDDHQALAERLRGLKGKFVLTMNDTPQTRACYGGFHIEAVELTYSAGGAHKQVAAREIVVSNWPG